MVFIDGKYIFHYEIAYILIDLNLIFPMKQSEFQISISVDGYDEKTSENYQNCYVSEKGIVSKLSKISITNFYDSDNTDE